MHFKSTENSGRQVEMIEIIEKCLKNPQNCLNYRRFNGDLRATLIMVIIIYYHDYQKCVHSDLPKAISNTLQKFKIRHLCSNNQLKYKRIYMCH